MLAALALALWATAQAVPPAEDRQEPPVTTGSDRFSAIRLQLTGHTDLHYLYRSGTIEETGALMNGLVPDTGSVNFWSGRLSLRADIEVKDFVTGVLELENRSFEKGINKPFGASPPDSPVQIRQGYIEVGRFLMDDLNVRIGVQNLTLRTRPMDEPFFLDLGESEGFFRGFQPGIGSIANSVDRDIGQPVGVRLFYSPFEVATIQAFWMVYGEGGGTPLDESAYGLVANSLLGENWSAWLLLCGVTGGGDRLGGIGTLGAGVDGFFGDAKELETFIEAYAQGGTLRHAPAAVHKEAYAFNVGARYVCCSDRKLWFEAAFSRRSGDRRPGNDRDQAFQSYENVNRFLILESAEFGLDVDTNVTSLRAALGVGPFDVHGRPLRLRWDVGRFAAVAPIGTAAAGRERQWGVENDVSLFWDYNDSLTFSLRGAVLGGSEILDRLTDERHAWLFVFGADLKF